MIYKTLREKLDCLWVQLDLEFQSFKEQLTDCAEYIAPFRPKWLIQDHNKGDRRNQKILDATGTIALRTLSSGMMAGITSPARPWFRLSTPDHSLNENSGVKNYLHEVTRRMQHIFLKSGLYNVLPNTYTDLGWAGTSPILVEENVGKRRLRFKSIPVGSFRIGANADGQVNVFARELKYTVRQLVAEFGMQFTPDGSKREIDWSRFSDHVKECWDNGNKETWVEIRHVIQPNDDYKQGAVPGKFKKFHSCYYELGRSSRSGHGYDAKSKDIYLSESGYDYFPVLCPRWQTSGEDVMGTNCPGMLAIGDVKQLQHGKKRGAEAIDKMVRPPMKGPASMKGQGTNQLPGGVTFVPSNDTSGFSPQYQVNPHIQEHEMQLEQLRQSIRRIFFEDILLMLATDDHTGRTATEIAERKEEKLLALGPVLEQLNTDLLDPLIEITYQMMTDQGHFDDLEIPQELEGMDLKVEYISVMAQAQKLVGIGAIERLAQFVLQFIQVHPEVADKIDFDQMIDEYADAIGVVPRIIHSDDVVASIREQRNKVAQAQQSAEMITQATGAMKDLSQTSTEGDNALAQMMNQARAGQLAPAA